ncbi:MAG: dipeptidase, partial [Pseudomonas sp.]|nr:dipeptidase [Pseudomonas sp.]
MDFSLKHLAAATLMLASLSSFTTAAQANITPEQSATILKTLNDASVKDFRQFLNNLSKSDLTKS